MTAQQMRNRGSVLLMAVGLLTMLGLLGSAFLIVAGLNRKTAAAYATQGRMDAVAKSTPPPTTAARPRAASVRPP